MIKIKFPTLIKISSDSPCSKVQFPRSYLLIVEARNRRLQRRCDHQHAQLHVIVLRAVLVRIKLGVLIIRGESHDGFPFLIIHRVEVIFKDDRPSTHKFPVDPSLREVTLERRRQRFISSDDECLEVFVELANCELLALQSIAHSPMLHVDPVVQHVTDHQLFVGVRVSPAAVCCIWCRYFSENLSRFVDLQCSVAASVKDDQLDARST